MRVFREESRLPMVSMVVALVWLLPPSGARADETEFCHQFVTSLPFKITTPGHYCFHRNLSTALNSPPFAAITIDADFVWLDLNNFTLDGSPAGTGSNTTGILAVGNHKNITVRNGIVKGFFDGINLDGAGSNYTVENIWADSNYVNGIAVRGTGGNHVVRNNVVTNTGGSTDPGEITGPNAALGIEVSGPLSSTSNNLVTHTFNHSPQGEAVGISLDDEGDGQIGVNNHVIDSGNTGIACGPKVVLRDNVVLSAPQPYSLAPGCTKIGTTNFP
ncbi:MAG TPA: right-handed parallel beta-helix repeat-containing protein [Vicinamibacteria bacterium]|jgi:hypothetical protein|nr:right-handed parallel beta-helix repeat-containing protein [Vicinamibacteria bacterium]